MLLLRWPSGAWSREPVKHAPPLQLAVAVCSAELRRLLELAGHLFRPFARECLQQVDRLDTMRQRKLLPEFLEHAVAKICPNRAFLFAA